MNRNASNWKENTLEITELYVVPAVLAANCAKRGAAARPMPPSCALRVGYYLAQCVGLRFSRSAAGFHFREYKHKKVISVRIITHLPLR